MEKALKIRRADIFFRFKNGKRIAVEIQNSKISVKELLNRTVDYNQMGIYVLWILNGNSEAAASPKFPTNKKNIKINSVEKTLHQMYGGRVYYINLEQASNKNILFALHYTPSNKKPNKPYRTKFDFYYFRDSNFQNIPKDTLLCSDLNGMKIARFYDKNIKLILREKVYRFIQSSYSDFLYDLNYSKNKRQTKKLIKSVLKEFKKQYSKLMILENIYFLKEKLNLNDYYVRNLKRKMKK